jgi:hypothetical protein
MEDKIFFPSENSHEEKCGGFDWSLRPHFEEKRGQRLQTLKGSRFRNENEGKRLQQMVSNPKN